MVKALLFISCLLLPAASVRAEDGAVIGPVLIAEDAAGSPDAEIALRLDARNAPADAYVMVFKLPDEAKLSSGVALGQGYWLALASKLGETAITSPELPLKLQVCLLDKRLNRLTENVVFDIRASGVPAPAQTLANAARGQ